MRRILMFVPILAVLMIVLTPGQALGSTLHALTTLSAHGNAAPPADAALHALSFPDGTVAESVLAVVPDGPDGDGGG